LQDLFTLAPVSFELFLGLFTANNGVATATVALRGVFIFAFIGINRNDGSYFSH
tara:strand:- start:596 stop:757 length:162 start_codon:yes stop_codon:yes gene_type:complete